VNEPNIHHSSIQGHEPSVQGHEPSVQGHDSSVQGDPKGLDIARKAIRELLVEVDGLYCRQRKMKTFGIRCRCLNRVEEPDKYGIIHLHYRWWNPRKVVQVIYETKRGDLWEIPAETMEVILFAADDTEMVSWLSRMSRKDNFDEPGLFLGSVKS
jgi:hypothetical protein